MATIAPIPDNEQQRLEWLRQCDIMNTLPELVFDEAAQLAAQVCRVPTAAINFVDHDRQWSKSAVGQDKKQDSRDISFCAHAILQPDLMVVPDALGDQRFADNPLVLGDPYIRFYAGAPLITSEGYGLGSLCVIDRVPRQLSSEQAAVLRLLAHQIVGRIEMQRHVALQTELMAERERLLNEVKASSDRERTFFRDVLYSVTGGRLRLCQDPSELPRQTGSPCDWIRLDEPKDMRELRRLTRGAAELRRFPEARWLDLITAVGEAAMNAVLHGGGGRGRICGNKGTIQVWIEDGGRGIDMYRLPQAALARGYTTAGTLGHGMKMMLDTADRVFLLTGPNGTTVVLEQDIDPPLPVWLAGIS